MIKDLLELKELLKPLVQDLLFSGFLGRGTGVSPFHIHRQYSHTVI